jgi:hypothetical protein
MACEFNSSIECSCTASCPRHGKCCECVARHRAAGQFPACFFSAAAEKKYDRSFEMLLKDRQ